MWNLEKTVQRNLLAKHKQRHRHREQTYRYKGEIGGGMSWEIGIDIYPLSVEYAVYTISIKQITNNTLYSTRN